MSFACCVGFATYAADTSTFEASGGLKEFEFEVDVGSELAGERGRPDEGRSDVQRERWRGGHGAAHFSAALSSFNSTFAPFSVGVG